MNKKMRKVGEPVKLVICGSRYYKDYKQMSEILDKLLNGVQIETIITGGCKGTDTMAHCYAKLRGHDTTVIKADWEDYGSKAGPIRNTKMARLGNCTIAFVTHNSKGTWNMIRMARAYEHEYVHIVEI